ncbi:hypothetical protein B0T14DRAFT_518462 [Immersiella caudata]|uniref:Uncharacterized protein n=1 Tax=Immersiella caudata TaxID=314043 RepID=A0AA40BZB1_9PEZI|nr:hypothetical protein B0T14DRAFT_518462 [Immersiella caudata]
MENHFQGAPKIKVEARPSDIKLYIDSRIQRDSNFSDRVKEGTAKDGNLKEEIYHTIINKAQGIFVLAEMHMNHLLPFGQGTVGDIRSALSKLPKGQSATFQTAFQRIKSQSDIHKN